MRLLTKIFMFATVAFSTLTFSGGLLAQETPDVLVKRISQEVLDIAKTDKEIQNGNRQRIIELVENKIVPHTDLERATRFVAGRYWRTATPEQRQRLTEEFRTLLIYTYSGAMSQVRDQRIDVKPLRGKPKDDEVVVDSEFRKSARAEPVQVSYRLAKTPEGWKIYDVNVMGVWLGLTYRESFANEISKGGIDGLIQTLAEKNKQLKASSDRSAKG